MTVTDKPLKFDLTLAQPATAMVDASVFSFGGCFQELTANGLAAMTDADQTWFWTTSWRAGEREATAEIAAGGGERFANGEDFLAALEDLARE